MTTVNSISGGKTSAYIAANYPADYNIFSLVRTNDKSCQFPDAKIRQMVSDKIGQEFVGTLEQDEIIYTMFDLEQFIGQQITWITGKTFDEVLVRRGSKGLYLPNKMQRYCTTELKILPIFYWCAQNTDLPIEMRIGFRANEQRRADVMLKKLNSNGLEEMKATFSKHKNGNNKWEVVEYRKPSFPLIKDGIFKDNIEQFWIDKPVRFAYMNNCVGCFNRNEMLLKHMSNKDPKTFEWFAKQERESNYNALFKSGISYDKIKAHKTQHTLFDEDFNDCDSGYCGL
jgi:hypothetical protein